MLGQKVAIAGVSVGIAATFSACSPMDVVYAIADPIANIFDGGNDLGGINRGDVLTLVCGLFYALHILWTEKCNKEGCSVILQTSPPYINATYCTGSQY